MLELTYTNYGTAAVFERRGSWLHYCLRDTSVPTMAVGADPATRLSNYA